MSPRVGVRRAKSRCRRLPQAPASVIIGLIPPRKRPLILHALSSVYKLSGPCSHERNKTDHSIRCNDLSLDSFRECAEVAYHVEGNVVLLCQGTQTAKNVE